MVPIDRPGTALDDEKSTKIVGFDLPGVHDAGWAKEIETTAMQFTLISGVIQLISVMILEWSRDLTALNGQPDSVAGHALISTIILCFIVNPSLFCSARPLTFHTSRFTFFHRKGMSVWTRKIPTSSLQSLDNASKPSGR